MQNNKKSQLAINKIQRGNRRMSNFKYSLALILGIGLFNANSTSTYVDEDNLDELISHGVDVSVKTVEIGSEAVLNPHDYSRLTGIFTGMRELDLTSVRNILDFSFLRFSPKRLRSIKLSDRVARAYGVTAEALGDSLIEAMDLPIIFTSLSTPGSSVTKPMRQRLGAGGALHDMPVLERCMVVPKLPVDSRIRIDEITDVTHRAQGILWCVGDSGNWRASGTLIGRNLVLTAAHNVYDERKGIACSSVSFSAGVDGKSSPYGTQEVEAFYYPQAYTTSRG